MSTAGIKNVLLCKKDSLATTPVDPIYFGLRGNTGLESDSKDPVKTYLNQELRNMVNFKIEGESYQTTMFMLKKLIEWSGSNFDGQLVTSKQSDGTENVFKLIDKNYFGLEFQYEASTKKRAAKITLERAMEYTDAVTFISSANSATETIVAGANKHGFNYDLYRAPAFLGFTLDGLQVDYKKLKDYKLIIKTEGKKSDLTNTPQINYLTYELEVTSEDATISKITSLMDKTNLPAVTFGLQNQNGENDLFEFSAGTLSLKTPFKINDEERLYTIKLAGKVNRYDITFTGTDLVKSGTMKIG